MRLKSPYFEILLFLSIVFMGLINTFSFYGDPPAYEESSISDTLFRYTHVSDTLPYRKYKRITDSLKRFDDCDEFALKAEGAGINYIFPSYSEIETFGHCDDINPPGPRYYLRLPGYSLHDHAETAVNNGQFFTKSVTWDDNSTSYWRGHYVYTPTDARFVEGKPTKGGEPTPGAVLLPISKSSFRVVKTITIIVSALFAAFTFWIVLCLPGISLYRIAKDKAFKYKIYRSCYFIGWSLVVLALLPMASAFFFHLIFGARIPKEFYISVLRTFTWNKEQLLAGLIVILLGRAFQSGYNVQREHARIQQEHARIQHEHAQTV